MYYKARDYFAFIDMTPETPNKPCRRPRFSDAEILMPKEVELRADTIFGKLTPNNKAAMKNAAWKVVAAEVNVEGPREEQSCRRNQTLRRDWWVKYKMFVVLYN